MKRIAVIAVAAALFATTGAVAIAAETETDAGTSHTRVLTEAQLWQRDLLAGLFVGRFVHDVPAAAAITDLRTGDTTGTPIGWGAIFKLLQLAEAAEGNLSGLLEDVAGDQRGWAFGKRFKDLGWDPSISSGDDDPPKNFGQLMKQDRGQRGNQGQNP